MIDDPAPGAPEAARPEEVGGAGSAGAPCVTPALARRLATLAPPRAFSAVARRLAPLSFLLGLFLLLPIRLYQLLLSPILPPLCRFTPTCSRYAVEAIRRHGPLRGFLLTAFRICRCQPFCRGGYDPVPPASPERS
jgi:hypothetical protein